MKDYVEVTWACGAKFIREGESLSIDLNLDQFYDAHKKCREKEDK